VNPTLPSFQRVLSELLRSAENNILSMRKIKSIDRAIGKPWWKVARYRFTVTSFRPFVIPAEAGIQ